MRQGVNVLFTTQAQLCASLTAARTVGTAERKIATLARVPLLIIDDFGLKPMRPPTDEDFHDLIAERYEQAATIVTSNLDYIEWDQFLGGVMQRRQHRALVALAVHVLVAKILGVLLERCQLGESTAPLLRSPIGRSTDRSWRSLQ